MLRSRKTLLWPAFALALGASSIAPAAPSSATTPSSFTPGQPLSEDFEGITPPALPYGWVATNAEGPDPLWITMEIDAAPNHYVAYVDDPQAVSDKRLDSAPFRVLSNGAVLSLHLSGSFSLGGMSETWDGAVLEISVDGGAFQDILDAGGTFLLGGYNGTIQGSDNPLLGRSAWVDAAPFTQVVQLPPVGGSTVVLRWRLGSSTGIPTHFVDGLWIDAIQVCDGWKCGAIPTPEFVQLDSAGNGVWEPGEVIDVDPFYYNNSGGDLVLTGTILGITGPSGPDPYKVNIGSADDGTILAGAIGGCAFTGNCYNVQNDGTRPAQHWDAQMSEQLSTGVAITWPLHIGWSFSDVPASNLFYADIETVFHWAITGGCGGTNYCPDNPALRKQMAVFLLKSKYGAAYAPPPAVGIFADVPASDPFAPWIENLYNLGITGGCSVSPLSYCPDQTVLRKQMAVFLLKTYDGSSYVPPACQGIFSDVACPSPFADWIEALYNQQIAAGCGNNDFCPNNPNTRGQMAVFLDKTFGLKLYGP